LSSRAANDYCFLRSSVSKEIPGCTVDKILSTSEVISERFFSEAFFSTKTLILKVIKIRHLVSPRDALLFVVGLCEYPCFIRCFSRDFTAVWH
jgi:hypothetical protein